MRRSERRKKQNSHWLLAVVRWLGLFIFLVFCFLSFTAFKVMTLDKFFYLNKTSAGDGEVIIVDPQKDETLKYLIPAEIEFEASGGYGSYKLSSLWLLSEKDPQSGKLVTDTVVKNFSLPIYLWKNDAKSNLTIYQKIKIFLSVKKNANYEAKITNNKINNSILINFVNSQYLDNVLKIEVEDLTGTQYVIDKVSRIIEVIGSKISNNSKGYDTELDCEIIVKEVKIAEPLNNIFNCKVLIDSLLSSDIKLRLGAKFARRF